MKSDNYISKGALGFGIGSILAVLFIGPFGLIITAIAVFLSIISLFQKTVVKNKQKRAESIIGLIFAIISIIILVLIYY